MDIRLGGPDTKSIRFIEDFPGGFFFHSSVDNADPSLHNFLISTYFENGAALFGQESGDELSDVRKIVGEAFDDKTDPEIYAIIQYFVQRVRNHGHIEFLKQAEIWMAKVVADRKPETCKSHHGKIVSVADAASWIKWFQKLSDEEYERAVYGKDFGFPPFDLLCRCRLEGIIPGVRY